MQDGADEEAREEMAALIHELKERLQKAEIVSEEYQMQIEVLHSRMDDALKEQARLEERVHEEEERVEGLENEKRESVRQQRELETIYEAERATSMKEKEEAQLREEMLQETIQRLKETLAMKDIRAGDGEEGRLSRTCMRFSLPDFDISRAIGPVTNPLQRASEETLLVIPPHTLRTVANLLRLPQSSEVIRRTTLN